MARRYSDEELELINKLKLLKGKLKRPPQIRDVDNEPGMPSSKVYLRHFGPWSMVLDTVKYSSATYDPEDEAAELVKKIEREVPELPKVPGVAPEIADALEALEHGRAPDSLPIIESGTLEKVKEEIEAERPEKPKAAPKPPVDPVWKPNIKIPERKPEIPKKEPEIPKKEPEKKPEKKEEKPAEALKEETPTAKSSTEEVPTAKSSTEEVPTAKSSTEEIPKKEAAKAKADENDPILVNLLGTDVVLSYGDNQTGIIKASYLGKAEESLERLWNDGNGKKLNEIVCNVPIMIGKLATIDSHGLVRAFPEPKKGLYYLVPEEFFNKVQKYGRWTDDLLYPRDFHKDAEGKFIYIHQLGMIGS